MKTYTCVTCGEMKEYEPILVDGLEFYKRRICGPCIDRAGEEATRQREAQEQAELKMMWKHICPPLYATTNPNHPDISQPILTQVLAWTPKGDGVGLGLYGETGRAKTRIMFLLMKRLHFSGVRVAAMPAQRLSECFSLISKDDQAADAARSIIRQCRNASVLFLDDIGKEKLTPTREAEFYKLIEYRTSHLKPTMWTANAVGQELEAMMSNDRGGAIVRRLREFSEPIKV